MPPQGRLGDKSHVPICNHGCPACPHTCIGPGVEGSPDVKVNGRPALRMDDPGIHGGCCMKNDWAAIGGSGTVFINGKPAHRMGDQGQHCGGLGKLKEGSSNVETGGHEMLKLQYEQQKQQQMFQQYSNIMKSQSELQKGVIQNVLGDQPLGGAGEGFGDLGQLSGGSLDQLGAPGASEIGQLQGELQAITDQNLLSPISNISHPISELSKGIINNIKP